MSRFRRFVWSSSFTGFARAGFTLVEAAAVLIAAGAVTAVVAAGSGSHQPPAGGDGAPAEASLIGSLTKARAAARQLKDSTQVRGTIQALVIWAQNNKSQYPLPSAIDTNNHTVKETGDAKNTTSNIVSVLVFNGSISTELCVSPAEVNKKIRVNETYEFANPSRAVDPVNALWDPAFNANFLDRDRRPGNVSYAHHQPSEAKRSKWSDTFVSTEAVWGNRGPAIAEVMTDAQDTYQVKLRREKSKTYRIHGEPDSWEGNIGFNDGHVEFVTSFVPRKRSPEADLTSSGFATYTAKDAKAPEGTRTRLDCWFYDEPDDKDGGNLTLGIWAKAGIKAADYRGIWD